MAKADFISGQYVAIDHTPSTNYNAGDVIVAGNSVWITHRALTSGELGAVAVGNGIYSVDKISAASTGVTAGAAVYWSNAAQGATAVSTSNAFIGKAVTAAADSATKVLVAHFPQTP